MVSNDSLFDIIKSLNSSEKRYIKVIASAFKKNSEHIRLFDFLSNSNSWKPNLLSEFESGFIGNKAAIKKRYLKTQILSILRNYKSNNEAAISIINLINDADTLYGKGLFYQCSKTLIQAQKIAVKHERFGLLLEVLAWQRRLISSTFENYSFTEKDIFEEEKITTKKYNNVVWAMQLQSAIYEYKKKYGYVKKNKETSLDAIVTKKDICNKVVLLSKRAEFYYYWALSIYHIIHQHYEKGYQAASKIDIKYFNIVDNEIFFFGMLEYLTSCNATHRYEELLSRIKLINKFLGVNKFKTNALIKDLHFYYSSNYSLIANIALGNNQELLSTLNVVANNTKQKKNKMAEQMLQVLDCSLGHAYFALGDFAKAKKLYWELLNTTKTQIRNDVLYNVKLFYPIILYELRDYNLMNSEAISSYKIFIKNKKLFSMELSIINILLRINIHLPNNKQNTAKSIFSTIDNKWKENKTSISFEYYLIKFWAEAIINKTNTLVQAKKFFSVSKSNK